MPPMMWLKCAKSSRACMYRTGFGGLGFPCFGVPGSSPCLTIHTYRLQTDIYSIHTDILDCSRMHKCTKFISTPLSFSFLGFPHVLSIIQKNSLLEDVTLYEQFHTPESLDDDVAHTTQYLGNFPKSMNCESPEPSILLGIFPNGLWALLT